MTKGVYEQIGRGVWQILHPLIIPRYYYSAVSDLIRRTDKDIRFLKMVSFNANPDDENEPWIEKAAIEGYGFRIWHYIFFCFSAFTVLAILICCCVKIRIPRTKQEIEADYRRKKLAEKFRQRLRLIQNREMDALDLQRALEIIQEDYRREQNNMNCEYDISLGNLNIIAENKSDPQPSFAKKISNMLKFSKFSPNK